MSSDEDYHDVPAKRRRVQRACDMCRAKKRACDAMLMSTKKCTPCIQNGLDCVFAGETARRRSYVDLREPRREPTGLGPSVELAALTIRSMNSPTPDPGVNEQPEIALVEKLETLSVNRHRDRFHGQSSSVLLAHTAHSLRDGYEKTQTPVSRRPHFWTYDPAKERALNVGPYVFPEADLLSDLIDLYFLHTNLYFPLLHRPIFERSVADGLHLRDIAFGAVVLLVCANGSRFSDDPRVCAPGDEPFRCGWKYFDQLRNVFDHVFAQPTLYHLQYYCLGASFLQYSAATACWTLIGFGIRLAQDAGAHYTKVRGGTPTVESELWKRAFWVMICHDRLCSTALGRPCTTHYEDFDVELPIECDDEYWENEDPARAFKQPADRPSLITYFNYFIRLNNILAFSLQMLYSLPKAKRLLAVGDDSWEEHIVAELDSALNDWRDSIPTYLQLDSNLLDSIFFDQSAFLYCTYYQVQMTTHRPFIPMIRKGASIALPSLAICTNAARSCSHIADISRQRKGGAPVPVLVHAIFTSGLVLLLNIWSTKRTGLAPHMNSALSEVRKCMTCLSICEQRWQSAGCFWDVLHQLAVIDEPPPTRAPPAPPVAERSKAKRPREPDSQRYPAYADTSGPIALVPEYYVQLPQVQPPTMPTYTDDLGRLAVYHPHQESVYHPHQEMGYPNLVDMDSNASDYSDTFGEFPPYQPQWEGVDTMGADSMTIWANAPMGVQVNDWGTYFSELYGALDART